LIIHCNLTSHNLKCKIQGVWRLTKTPIILKPNSKDYSFMPSYSEIIQQISDLQKQADRQRKEEYASVLKTIKKQISEYGITPEELGFSAASAGSKRGRKPTAKAGKVRKPRAKRASTGIKVAPKYKDPATGGTWTGRGKMPKWVSAAVASGRSLESLLISPATSTPTGT
jgi:DNA-binding protein H-NS